MAPAAFVQVIE